MPLTLAHPAAVLPLRAKWPDAFVALLVGSVAPDLPYFMPGQSGLRLPNGHTSLGSVLVSLPLGLALLVLLVAARTAVAAPLWGAHREVVTAELERVRRSHTSWIMAVPAVLLGAWIHILWDSFTHLNGWMARHSPLLSQQVTLLPDHPMSVCRLLQYASSVVGCLVLGIWYRNHLRDHVRSRAQVGPLFPAGSRPVGFAVVVAISCLWGAFAVLHAPARYHSVHGLLYVLSTSTLATAAVLYPVFGLLLVFTERARAGPTRSGCG